MLIIALRSMGPRDFIQPFRCSSSFALGTSLKPQEIYWSSETFLLLLTLNVQSFLMPLDSSATATLQTVPPNEKRRIITLLALFHLSSLAAYQTRALLESNHVKGYLCWINNPPLLIEHDSPFQDRGISSGAAGKHLLAGLVNLHFLLGKVFNRPSVIKAD